MVPLDEPGEGRVVTRAQPLDQPEVVLGGRRRCRVGHSAELTGRGALGETEP